MERPARFFQDIKNGWDFFPFKEGTIFQYWSDSKMVVDIPTFISDWLAERTVIAGVESIRERCDVVAKEMAKGKKTGPLPADPAQQKK